MGDHLKWMKEDGAKDIGKENYGEGHTATKIS